MTGTDIAEVLINGLSFSSILILTALGLAITFGVMRVINMAHGEMLMLGAYTAYVLEDPVAIPILVRNLGRLLGHNWHSDFGLHLNLFWALPISFVVVAAVGYAMEVGLVRFLYGRPLDTLLATWGVSLILQQTVLLLFEADLKPLYLPVLWLPTRRGWFKVDFAGSWHPTDQIAIPIYRVFIVVITGLCLLAVYWWFYRTSFGLKIRAVTQNRAMASALGISTRRVDSLTFAFATGLAGLAGCIFGHLYTVKYNMGPDYIVEAFMVVILGGMGQLAGSVAGGTLLGTSDSFVEKLLVNASMAKVWVLFAVIVVILMRPSGLFTRKGRSYD